MFSQNQETGFCGTVWVVLNKLHLTTYFASNLAILTFDTFNGNLKCEI